MAKTEVDEKDKTESEEVDEETQDESQEEDVETEDEENESDDEDSQEETDDEDKAEEPFKKRYTQIKGSTPEEYLPNLEDAYKNSSSEAVRLKAKVDELQDQVDKITALVANNPEIAEQIKDGKAPEVRVDPALLKARQDMENQNQKEYSDFVGVHPELESDADLQKQVFETIKDFAEVAAKKNRVLGMKEALTKAWLALGLEDKSKDEEVRMKAKDSAARGKSAGTSKKADTEKVTFTEAQINAGMQMGLGNTRQEVIKKLNKYAK